MKKILLASAFIAALVSCKKDEEPATPPVNNSSQTVSVPAALKGQVLKMECTHEEASAPYKKGQKANFTISSSGYLFIDDDPVAADGDEITISNGPSLTGKEYIWEDKNGGYKYAISLKADSSVHEINVSTSADVFKNQFEPKQSGGNTGLDLIKRWKGSHFVDRVLKGSHTSKVLQVEADGSIEFDKNIRFDVNDYVLITDKSAENYMLFIDMKPYTTEPYPRLEVKIKTMNKMPEKMTYYPSYPQINGRVEVMFK